MGISGEGGRGGAAALAVGACLAAALAVAPPAHATLTMGSALATPPDSSASCGVPDCSLSQTALPGRTVTSPVNGTVLSWKVWWASAGSVRFRVVRPMGASALFLSSSATEAVPSGLTPFAFSTSLPIAIGDRIGLDDLGIGPGNPVGRAGVAGATMDSFNPAPVNGSAGAVIPTGPGLELSLSAEVEPTSAFSLGAVKAKPKQGTATLTATLPNPGTLAAQSGGSSSAGAAAKAASLVKPASVAVGAPGAAELKLVPTKSAKRKLKRKGKAKGPVNVTFTPSFGAAATLTTQVKLKLKP